MRDLIDIPFKGATLLNALIFLIVVFLLSPWIIKGFVIYELWVLR